MKRTIAALLTASLAFAAVRGEEVAYIGGTLKIPAGTEGALDTDDAKALRFQYGKETYTIPYASVSSMEFGQKVGRRVGATIALGATTLGLMALPMLFSKKKKHYLTIGFQNAEGANEAVIFELSKGLVRETILLLETRTGKRVELNDQEIQNNDVSHVVTEKAAVAQIATPTPLPDYKLTLESTPGAEIIIDGKPVGVAPLTTMLPQGSHLVLIRSDGHKPWTRTVLAKPGESQTITAELAPAQAPAVVAPAGYVIQGR